MASAPGRREKDYPRRRGAWSMFWKYFSDSGVDGARLKDFEALMNTPARDILHQDSRILPVGAVRLLDRADQVFAALNSGGDPLRTAWIAREDVPSADLLRRLESLPDRENRLAGFQGRVLSYSPNRIEYEVSLDRPAAVLFNEIFYPGWILKEGDVRAPLFRLNGAFRGTFLEAGRHRLTMRFLPGSFRWGWRISAATAVVFLAIYLAQTLRRIYSRLSAAPSAARDQRSIPPAE